MKKKSIIMLSIIVAIVLTFTGMIIINRHKDNKTTTYDDSYGYISGEFNLNLIKTVNETNEDNYLISPYSIEIALNMLKEGADRKSVV